MITALFDASVQQFRFPTTSDSWGEVQAVPVATGQTLKTTLQTPRIRNRDDGAGEHSVGYMTAYFAYAADVVEQDVLYCSKGPNAGTWWKVVALFKPSKKIHVEATIEPYIGKKPLV